MAEDRARWRELVRKLAVVPLQPSGYGTKWSEVKWSEEVIGPKAFPRHYPLKKDYILLKNKVYGYLFWLSSLARMKP